MGVIDVLFETTGGAALSSVPIHSSKLHGGIKAACLPLSLLYLPASQPSAPLPETALPPP